MQIEEQEGGEQDQEMIVTFTFLLPPEESDDNLSVIRFARLRDLRPRRPSPLISLITQNAHMIANFAVQSWFMQQIQPENQIPPASADAMNNLDILPYILSGERRRKHRLCAICQEDFINPENIEMEDCNKEDIVRMPCHHLYHKSCIISWLSMTANCPHCRYGTIYNNLEILTDNEIFNSGIKDRMKARDEKLKSESDTDVEDEVVEKDDLKSSSKQIIESEMKQAPAYNTRSKRKITDDDQDRKCKRRTC